MIALKERYVVDGNGARIGILLDMEDYRRLLEELEEMESIRAYDAAKASSDRAVPWEETKMKCRVKLEKTEEGHAVWCPGLPGCWSRGVTEEEALENIRDAIATHLATAEALMQDKVTRLVDVPV
jgi:predicted RNase H-like HicB family nuclease